MTTQTDRWTDRYRLHGGRNTHASRPTSGIPDGITACGYPIGDADHPQPENTPVTCRACLREINR